VKSAETPGEVLFAEKQSPGLMRPSTNSIDWEHYLFAVDRPGNTRSNKREE